MTTSCRILLVVSLLLGGCAPISEVLQSNLASAQYLDAIEKGESWLKEANLERQASAEGRKVHRLVAEAYLGLAIARGRLKDFEAFREKYAKFSAYESLLSRAYEEEAKVALKRKVGPNPTWTDFEWFETRYGQSSIIDQARARVLNAELGRLKVNPSLEGYRLVRTRFASWPEFAPQSKSLLREEGLRFAQERLKADAGVETYREFARLYPDVLTPEHISILTRLELSYANEQGDQTSWQELIDRYPLAWATPLRTKAQSGLLGVRVKAAADRNIAHAFDQLRVQYFNSSAELKRELELEICTWLIAQAQHFSQLRQRLRKDLSTRLLDSFETLGVACVERIKPAYEGLSQRATEGDYWANRVLRRAELIGGKDFRAPVTREAEAASIWRLMASTQNQTGLLDVLEWYANLAFGLMADKQLTLNAQKLQATRRVRVSIAPFQSQNRKGFESLVTLHDRHIGPVSVGNGRLVLTPEAKGMGIELESIEPLGRRDIWFAGALDTVGERSFLRDQLLTVLRYASVFGRTLGFGTVEMAKKGVAWRKSKNLDRLIESIGMDGAASFGELYERLTKALTRRALQTLVFHLISEREAQRLFDNCKDPANQGDCSLSEGAQIKGPDLGRFGQRLLVFGEQSAAPLRAVSQQFGGQLLSSSELSTAGLALARTSRVRLKGRVPENSEVPIFGLRRQLVWYWNSESAYTKPQMASDTSESSIESPSTEPWGEGSESNVTRYESKLGTVAVVIKPSAEMPRLFARLRGLAWEELSDQNLALGKAVFFATFLQLNGKTKVRVFGKNGQFQDWSTLSRTWGKLERIRANDAVEVESEISNGLNFSHMTGLHNRANILLGTDTASRLWRSIDGGENWYRVGGEQRYDQVRQYYLEETLVCARVKGINAEEMGVECSVDDGASWQRFLTVGGPLEITSDAGTMKVNAAGRNLELGDLVDQGRIASELLFVSKGARVTQTGRWFSDQLKRRVDAFNDYLFVSSPLDDRRSDEVNQGRGNENRLPIFKVGLSQFDGLGAPMESMRWGYAVVGRLQ